MRETAATNNVFYTDWDADQILGCQCDTGYAGYNCNDKQCPLGDDPGTTGIQEIQVLRTSINFLATVQLVTLTGTDVPEVRFPDT